jgi:endonuclease/exonuclease/phosphatase family metal-dependent hydrolase
VLTGDFNAGENNPAITYLTGKAGAEPPVKLVDTFRLLHPDVKDVRTGHSFRGGRQGHKIDYVLAQPSAQVLEAEILYDNVDGRYPSDHYPVTARLRLPVAGKR